MTESDKDRRYGYIIPHHEVPSNVTWEHEPLNITISLNNDSEDDKPIYMIAKSEEGSRDCYGDFDYGYCPLTKYATNSNMVSSKTLPKKSHGYGCAGYVERMTNNYLVIGGAKFSKKHGWMCCNHDMFAKLAVEEDIERVEKKKSVLI